VKPALYIGGLLGLLLLVGVVLRADLGGIVHAVAAAGWPIFWVIPYRLLFFVLYALGWALLLRPYNPRRQLSLGFLTWAATVREGIDRLLPVASVGGAVAGVRFLRWRGVDLGAATASVIVEVLLTLAALAAFTLIGLLLLLVDLRAAAAPLHRLAALVIAALALPLGLAAALRSGSVFARLEAAVSGLIGIGSLSVGAATLDREVRAILRRGAAVTLSGSLQLLAFLSGIAEVWLALRLFGHPLSLVKSTVMESLTQAARHVAFLVPGALGVQEVSLVFLGNLFGVTPELALGVSLIKRMREIAWGIPALISWQWQEGRRLAAPGASS
jgi:putative membrane protein